LEVDRFLLEYDDERSGTFSPLRFVPKGKIVVLRIRFDLRRQSDIGEWCRSPGAMRISLCQNCARIQRFQSIRVIFERKADAPIYWKH
jgi:hypothetical protein